MLNEMAKSYYENAKDKGFWDNERNFGEAIALMHSELSEALEEHRDGHEYDETYYRFRPRDFPGVVLSEFTSKHPYVWVRGGVNLGPTIEIMGDAKYVGPGKPEGIPAEFADTIIRILDWCGAHGIDIDGIIEEKAYFNTTRERLHGKTC